MELGRVIHGYLRNEFVGRTFVDMGVFERLGILFW